MTIKPHPDFMKAGKIAGKVLSFIEGEVKPGVKVLKICKLAEEKIIEFFEETNQAKSRLLIYSCTSGYPVAAKDVALLEINRMYEKYSSRVNEIGFSGHHLGVAIDIAAYALGARWIERHFTKDKTWKGQALHAPVSDRSVHPEEGCGQGT